MTNFAFLPNEFKALSQAATLAEGHILGDPRAACFHARFALEAGVHWLYRHDASLRPQPTYEEIATFVHTRGEVFWGQSQKARKWVV